MPIIESMFLHTPLLELQGRLRNISCFRLLRELVLLLPSRITAFFPSTDRRIRCIGNLSNLSIFCQEFWIFLLVQDMPHLAQKQEQLFPWTWATEVINAAVILYIYLHLSTLLKCLNSCQLYFFCHFFNMWKYFMLEDTVIYQFFLSSWKLVGIFCSFFKFISSTAFVSFLVCRAGSKLHMSVYSPFITALTFPLSAQKQSLYCRHQIQQWLHRLI